MKRDQWAEGVFKNQVIPLHHKLSSTIREMITQNEWPVGGALPSEAELARRFGVSVGTTRKALGALETSGWVTRKQGRGTFVIDPFERQYERFYRLFFSKTKTSVLRECTYEIISCERRLPTQDETLRLEISGAQDVIVRKQRLRHDSTPILIETQILSADTQPSLDDLARNPGDLFKILHNCGAIVWRCEERLQVVTAPPDVAQELSLAGNTGILHSELILIDADDNVLALIERWFAAPEIEYAVALS